MPKYQVISKAMITRTITAADPAEAVALFKAWRDKYGEREISGQTTLLPLGSRPEVFDEHGRPVGRQTVKKNSPRRPG